MRHDGGMTSQVRPHSLGSARWNELDKAVTLLIPIGSCEQHGHHLPLDTDTQIALEIAHRAASHIDDCLVAPPITISASGEHQGFPGTLSIGNEAVTLSVIELCRSADWARRIVLVNGHGGNIGAITAACEVLAAEGRPALDWWPSGSNTDLHAGRIETSVMLLIDPDKVDTASMATGPIPSFSALTEHGVQDLSPTGVLGDPHGATAAEGKEWLTKWTTDLVNAITRDIP